MEDELSEYDKQLISSQIQRHMDYLLAEGVVVIDRYQNNSPVYRLKTEEEIQAELDAIESL